MINEAGLAIIREFESFRSYPYKDQKGIWTQGFGRVKGITAFSTPITEQEGEAWLAEDIQGAEATVNRLASCPLNENQYAALVSLVYNCGQAPLLGTLGHYLDQEDYASAADQFLRWVHAGAVVSAGLVRRRQAERQLFLLPCT